MASFPSVNALNGRDYPAGGNQNKLKIIDLKKENL
jgi:hypothetical protein